MSQTIEIPMWALWALLMFAVVFGGFMGFCGAAYSFVNHLKGADRIGEP